MALSLSCGLPERVMLAAFSARPIPKATELVSTWIWVVLS